MNHYYAATMKLLYLRLIPVLWFAGSPAFLSGQILQIRHLSGNTIQFQKSEWEIKLNSAWENPYNDADIALNMILTAPSGRELLLPCYYESGNSNDTSVWKARFAAREAGGYTYRFELLKNSRVIDQSGTDDFMVSASGKKGFLKANDSWTFRYDNGDLFRGIGMNICWESRDEDDSRYFEGLHEDPKYNYDYMLKKLAQNGGNFFRTWMIYWNLPVDWKTVKNNRRYRSTASPFNESGMARMDRLTELCDSLGLHLMLALDSHAGFIGTGWELNNYNVVNGGPAQFPLEFFTLPEAKAQYKDKLRLMVARYGYSPSIAAWEFFNEIDNVIYAGKPEDRIPDSVITAWHDEMSTYLKEVDPYDHLVTTSVSHRDVAGMNDLAVMDFNQRHMYKNTDAIPSTLNEYSQKHGKPYIIGEFGYEWDWSKNFNDFGREMDNDFRRGLWYGLFSPTPVMPMSWWWEFFENRGMMEYFRHVKTFSDTLLNSCGGRFEPFEVSGTGGQMQAYGVQVEGQAYVYLYNKADHPADVEIHTRLLPGRRQIRTYDCETGEFSSVTITVSGNTLRAGQVQLQPASGIVIYWKL